MLDLFSGAGGLTEGFGQASSRFSTVRAVEFDKEAAASYAANHGEEVVFPGPIEAWLQAEEVPTVDVVVGGPPCQGFSALGKKDLLDHRNELWRHYADTISRAQPKIFVLENVPDFLTSPQFESFRALCKPGGFLSEYSFRAEVLNAADFGTAQLRRRVIVIGHHRDIPFPGFPPPTHSEASWKSVRDAIADLPHRVDQLKLPGRSMEFAGKTMPGSFITSELHLDRTYQPISLARFKHIPVGGNRFDLPTDLQAPCWRNHRSGAVDVMGRLRWDSPSVTIRTEFFKPEKGRYLHPVSDRALTHHEAARLQGFPDHYRWAGSKVSIARQIGNAVPIPLARAIGRHLAFRLR